MWYLDSSKYLTESTSQRGVCFTKTLTGRLVSFFMTWLSNKWCLSIPSHQLKHLLKLQNKYSVIQVPIGCESRNILRVWRLNCSVNMGTVEAWPFWIRKQTRDWSAGGEWIKAGSFASDWMGQRVLREGGPAWWQQMGRLQHTCRTWVHAAAAQEESCVEQRVPFVPSGWDAERNNPDSGRVAGEGVRNLRKRRELCSSSDFGRRGLVHAGPDPACDTHHCSVFIDAADGSSSVCLFGWRVFFCLRGTQCSHPSEWSECTTRGTLYGEDESGPCAGDERTGPRY